MIPTCRKEMESLRGQILIRILDARVRPSKVAWPPPEPKALPTAYLVVRRGGFLHRTHSFASRGVFEAASRLPADATDLCQSSRDLKRLENLIMACDEVVVDIGCRDGSDVPSCSSLHLEIDVLNCRSDQDDGPIDVFEPEPLCEFYLPLEELCGEQRDRWLLKSSHGGRYDVEVRIFTKFFGAESPIPANSEAPRLKWWEDIYSNSMEDHDSFGHCIAGQRNIVNCHSFESLHQSRCALHIGKWAAELSRPNFDRPDVSRRSLSPWRFSLDFVSRIRDLVWHHGVPPSLREEVYRQIAQDVLRRSACSGLVAGAGVPYYTALVGRFEFLCHSAAGQMDSPTCSSVSSGTSSSEYFDSLSVDDDESDGRNSPALSDVVANIEMRDENFKKGHSLASRTTASQIQIASNMAKSVLAEIEKDVDRVFKHGKAYVNGMEGKSALRRVLGAYAMRNPSVGYCQGMNFIAGLLLQVVSEETAFWVLAAIVEGSLPGYHDKSMRRGRADISAMRELLEAEFPELSDTAATAGLPLELVVTPWLLVCFINFLPAPTAIRCLEITLIEGPIGMFSLSMAFIRLYEEIFSFSIGTDSLVRAVSAVQNGAYDSQLLIDQAAVELSRKADYIRTLREHHFQQLLKRKSNGVGSPDAHVQTTLLSLLGWAESKAYEAIPPLRLLGGGVKGVATTTVRTIQWLLGFGAAFQLENGRRHPSAPAAARC